MTPCQEYGLLPVHMIILPTNQQPPKPPTVDDQDLLSYLETDWCTRRPFLSPDDMAYYLQFRLFGKPKDTACVVYLNRKRCFLQCIQLTEGALHRVNLLSEALKQYQNNAAYLFLGHTHGTDGVDPSPEDRRTTRIMLERYADTPLFLGHFIVNHHLDCHLIQP